mgnify:FL=1
MHHFKAFHCSQERAMRTGNQTFLCLGRNQLFLLLTSVLIWLNQILLLRVLWYYKRVLPCDNPSQNMPNMPCYNVLMPKNKTTIFEQVLFMPKNETTKFEHVLFYLSKYVYTMVKSFITFTLELANPLTIVW